MICANCGTDNGPGSRFCDQCGGSLAAPCPACGRQNRPEARFCAACGSPLPAAGPASVPPAGGVPVSSSTAAGPAGPAAPAVPAAGPQAERRLVTVLFADLVGFTSFAEDRDPEAVRELLARYFAAAGEAVARHGGTIEKFIGDAVMAVWGTPVAHEDDAERSVRAALELLDAVRVLGPGLDARAGLLTGEAAVTLGAHNQGMVAGDLVNTAARLQGVAEPGTVLVGEATMRAASGAVLFEPLGEHSLRGKTAPVPAWRALRVVSGRGGQGRTDTLEAPFVGREEELRLLKDQLHAVGREGRVRLVSITGPAGIGKSRLVWELEKYVDGVTEPVWWHRGRSPSYGEGITFWALGEMVRRRAGLTEDADEARTRERVAAALAEHVPEPAERERITPALLSLLGVEPAPPGGREALFPAWRLFFERVARRGTTVLVFEDLQWADVGLLDFIDHLLDWSRGLPILVVTLARPELFERRPDWGAGRRHFTGLALDPLPDAAVRSLLAGLVPGLPAPAVEAIVRRAEGMPLYAVETVRSLLADGRIERHGDAYVPVGDLSDLAVPESLRSLIASRLDALEPTDRALLADAAVLGQVFAPDALAAISGRTPADVEARLRDLTRRELVDLETDPASPERGQYKFVQSLIREVAYGTLARRDRRARHLAVARHYEAVGDEATPGILAAHYLAAHALSEPGPEAEAIAAQARIALSAAADRAIALGAHDEAVGHLDQALAITADPHDRALLLERAANSAVIASRPDAEAYARSAIAAYDELGDTIAGTRASARLGKVLIDLGDLPAAIRVLEDALRAAEALGDRAVLAETLAHLSRAYMRTADNEKAVAAADRALAIAEVDNREDIVAEALVNRGSALSALGRRRESVALLRAALELVRASGEAQLEMRTRNNLASCMAEDDPIGATRLVLESLEVAAEIGDRGIFRWLAGTAAYGRYFAGFGWDEQLALSREILEASTVVYERVRIANGIVLIEAARGERLERLIPELDELVAGHDDPDLQAFRAIAASEVALLQGQPRESFQVAMAATPLPVQNPELLLSLALRAAVHGRDRAGATDVAARIEALPLTGALTRSLRQEAAGAVAALEGRRAEALDAFRPARATLLRLGQRFEASRTALSAVLLLPEEPEPRAWVAEARAVFEELRARAYVEAVDRALAAGPAGAPRPVPALDPTAVES